MITDQDILNHCISKGNKTPTQEDVNAFRRFMRHFQCEDAETVEEAHEKIQISMRDISHMLENTPKHLHEEKYFERMGGL